MLTIRGGWPTRIEQGVAYYVKRREERFTRAERLVWTWLTNETGLQPCVEYFDVRGNRTVFGNLEKFEKAYPPVSRQSLAQKKAWKDPATRAKRTKWWKSEKNRAAHGKRMAARQAEINRRLKRRKK